MASFLTLLSRYIGKKTKFVEKQQVKTEKEKKEKAKQFAKTYPSHEKQLRAWEKTYGEKKQSADEKYNNERKKRVMKARAMGPSLRKKKYRTASIYMAKDPFSKPPVKTRSAKTTYLTKKAKKKNDFITKINAPIKEELIKENTIMAMPPIKNISQSLIDAVKQAQLNQPASIDKPLDMSLKGIDNKQPLKEEALDENIIKKVSRFLDKASGRQANRLHNKLEKKMNDKQVEILGHRARKDTVGHEIEDNAKLNSSKRYTELDRRRSLTDPVVGHAYRTGYFAAKKDLKGKGYLGMQKEENVAEAFPSDPQFIKKQIEGHRRAAAEAKKRGDHHTAMGHEQRARDYEQHGMHGDKWETSSGLKYEEVNMDTVTEGAKKVKLTPGMKAKDYKRAKTAVKTQQAKKVAKKATPSLPKVTAAPAAGVEDEDDKMLSRLLKGKLRHGDHPHLAKAIVSKIRSTHVKDRSDLQKKIYNAKPEELNNLLK